jgi:hypothetical protein
MNLERIIAVGGRSGLFKMIANQKNGLLLEDLHDQKRSFVSGRLNQFTPLESISIYVNTEEGTVALSKVFENMLAALPTQSVPASDALPTLLRGYLLQILPDHDTDKVLISDIRKMVKWFAFLHAHNLVTPAEVAEVSTTTEEAK